MARRWARHFKKWKVAQNEKMHVRLNPRRWRQLLSDAMNRPKNRDRRMSRWRRNEIRRNETAEGEKATTGEETRFPDS